VPKPAETSDAQLHPVLSPERRQELFAAGVRCFNHEDYFAAHELWEEIWRSTTPEPRDLFQGLIQLAVGLYHYRRRHRPAPAARVLSRGLRRLEPLAPTCHGVDLAALLASGERWRRWLEAAAEEASGSGEQALEEPALPRIRILDPDEMI
jgi:predicted metal-dependent hydrolase